MWCYKWMKCLYYHIHRVMFVLIETRIYNCLQLLIFSYLIYKFYRYFLKNGIYLLHTYCDQALTVKINCNLSYCNKFIKQRLLTVIQVSPGFLQYTLLQIRSNVLSRESTVCGTCREGEAGLTDQECEYTPVWYVCICVYICMYTSMRVSRLVCLFWL